MNPTKIDIPENILKKLETETNLLSNINGLIQGKNLIVNDNSSDNININTNSSNKKTNYSNNESNSIEDLESKSSNSENSPPSKKYFFSFF